MPGRADPPPDAKVAPPVQEARSLAAAGQREAGLALLRGWTPGSSSPAGHSIVQANALQSFGETDAGETLLREAHSRFPKAATIAVALARSALLRGAYDEADAGYAHALSLNPDSAPLIRQVLRALRSGRGEAMGFELSLPRDVIGPRTLLALLSGNYEARERQAALADIRDGDRVLELGTGAGIIALSLNRAHPGVPIMTVEANPELAEVAAENFARNGCSAEIVSAIAALEDGEADFFLAPEFWVSSSRPSALATRRIRQRCVDVNRLIEAHAPSVLVLDIEGGEVELLPALALDGIRRIVVELHPFDRTAAENSATIAHLLDQGFLLDLAQGHGNVFVFARADDRTFPPTAQETTG